MIFNAIENTKSKEQFLSFMNTCVVSNERDIYIPHNIDNLLEVWPWEHAEKDPNRHYTGPRPKGG